MPNRCSRQVASRGRRADEHYSEGYFPSDTSTDRSVLRLHAAGYGEFDPVHPNSDNEKRNANRRVELVMMPDVEEMLDIRRLI